MEPLTVAFLSESKKLSEPKILTSFLGGTRATASLSLVIKSPVDYPVTITLKREEKEKAKKSEAYLFLD